MILKKPYAFLIKYFKLIHLALTLFMVNVFVHSTGAYGFFTSYIRGENVILGFDYVGQHFNFLLILSLFVIMTFSIIMLVLMKKKEKPFILYVFYIVLYSFMIGVMVLTYNNMSILENSLLDVRVIRANRDLYSAAIVLQFLALAFAFVRTLGFDIKKFDFKKDLQGLEISERDKEEIEVSISLDHIDPKAEIIKVYHNARYIILENKFIYQIIAGSIVGVIVLSFAANRLVFDKPYAMGQNVNTDMFAFRVNDSYLTNRGFDNRTLTNNNQLIVLNLGIRDVTRSDRVLDSSVLKIEIDGQRFNKTKEYNQNLVDLGVPYNRQQLKPDFDDYLIAFEVFDNLNFSNAKLIISDVERDEGSIFNVERHVNLNVEKIDKPLERTSVYFGESIIIPYLGEEIDVRFDGAFLNTEYLTQYRYCLRQEECYFANEMIRLDLQRRHRDTMLSIEYEVDLENKNIIEKILNNNTMFLSELPDRTNIYQDVRVLTTNRRLRHNGSLVVVSESDFSNFDLSMVVNVRNHNYAFKFERETGDSYEGA